MAKVNHKFILWTLLNTEKYFYLLVYLKMNNLHLKSNKQIEDEKKCIGNTLKIHKSCK